MKHLFAVLIAVALAAGSLAAQSPSPHSSEATANYRVPRTPDGRPDLQGVWGNNSVTPMTRPTQWRDKASLTDAEVAELQGLVARFADQGGDAIFRNIVQLALDARDSGKFDQTSYDPTTGNYNEFWMVDRDWDNRTSLITDPPTGLFPALTPAAEARRAQRPAGSGSGILAGTDGPEDRPLSERCISYGAPRTAAGYNSYVQIIQSPETVVLLQEMIHDARVVPMDGRPFLPENVRQLHGDSRGRWEGDTLVVETRNYINGFQGSTPNVRVTERYTRTSDDFLDWSLTLDDPDTWVQPWTFMIRLKRSNDQIYEYACHEGNHSMIGILAGARAEEQKAAAAQSGSR